MSEPDCCICGRTVAQTFSPGVLVRDRKPLEWAHTECFNNALALSVTPWALDALITRLEHWKHTVPTTRERAEMIEAMREAASALRDGCLQCAELNG